MTGDCHSDKDTLRPGQWLHGAQVRESKGDSWSCHKREERKGYMKFCKSDFSSNLVNSSESKEVQASVLDANSYARQCFGLLIPEECNAVDQRGTF